MKKRLKSAANVPEYFHSLRLNASSGSFAVPSATVEIEKEGAGISRAAVIGEGIIDAAFRAIMEATQTNYELVNFHLLSVTEGTDAEGDCIVQLLANGKVFKGKGSHKDVVTAAAYAYVDALNRAEHWKMSQTEKLSAPVSKAV